MPAAVGPLLVNRILQTVGDTKRECRRLAKLQRAFAVLVAECQSCRGRRQEILENVAHKLDAIARPCADTAGETKKNAREPRRCVTRVAFHVSLPDTIHGTRDEAANKSAFTRSRLPVPIPPRCLHIPYTRTLKLPGTIFGLWRRSPGAGSGVGSNLAEAR